MQLNKDAYRSIKTKVFQKDLLEGTLIGNFQKIFVMPIYKDISDFHLLPQWRSSKSGPSHGGTSGASQTLSFNKLRSALTGGGSSGAAQDGL